jgi:hypothetical protein
VNPPKVQHLEVSGVRPVPSGVRQSAEALSAAIGAGGTRSLRLMPSIKQRDLAATLEGWRIAYGACRLGDVIESDGAGTAKFLLACDRGPLELTVTMEEGRIASAAVAPPASATCVSRGIKFG